VSIVRYVPVGWDLFRLEDEQRKGRIEIKPILLYGYFNTVVTQDGK